MSRVMLFSVAAMMINASARSAIIDFDSIPNGDVAAQYAPSGVVFDVGEWVVSDEVFGGAIIPASGTKYVRPITTPSTISFVVPGTSNRGIIDSFSWVDCALNANTGGTYDGYTVIARDQFGITIDSETVQPASSPPGRAESVLTLSGTGIYEIEIVSRIQNPLGSSAVPIDDIQFGEVRAVPEPMSLTGIVLIAACIRRERKA